MYKIYLPLLVVALVFTLFLVKDFESKENNRIAQQEHEIFGEIQGVREEYRTSGQRYMLRIFISVGEREYPLDSSLNPLIRTIRSGPKIIASGSDGIVKKLIIEHK